MAIPQRGRKMEKLQMHSSGMLELHVQDQREYKSESKPATLQRRRDVVICTVNTPTKGTYVRFRAETRTGHER